MADDVAFRGVVCYCLDKRSRFSSIVDILDIRTKSEHRGLTCHELKLSNKYYQTTIHLFDHEQLVDSSNKVLEDCHAIILIGDGETTTVEQLDDSSKKLKDVGGEPRILLCHGLDENCSPYKTLQEWCFENGYGLFLAQESDIKTQIKDSLSAYRWVDSRITSDTSPSKASSCIGAGQSPNPNLDERLLKQMADFDSLLHKIGAYRDNPSARGDPDDKNIEEIAGLLTGLLGDDSDEFLLEDKDQH